MVQVIPGAESWSAEGGEVGALLIHGFTGNPVSLRPLAEDLANAGMAVELPRLPGHGTRWQDLRRARARDWTREAIAGLARLRARTSRRIVIGFSMGGSIALHLAAQQPAAFHGLVLINPWVEQREFGVRLLPVLKHIRRRIPGRGNDIALPGADEKPYPVVPLKAGHSMIRFQQALEFERVTTPLLLLSSRRDHTAPPFNSRIVLDRVRSEDRQQVWLEHSFHVATLDHDAPLITEHILAFAERIAGRKLADA